MESTERILGFNEGLLVAMEVLEKHKIQGISLSVTQMTFNRIIAEFQEKIAQKSMFYEQKK